MKLDIDSIVSGDLREVSDIRTSLSLKIMLDHIDGHYMPLREMDLKGHIMPFDSPTVIHHLEGLTGVFEHDENGKEALLKLARLGSPNRKEILFTGAHYCLYRGDLEMARAYFLELAKYFEEENNKKEAEKFRAKAESLLPQ